MADMQWLANVEHVKPSYQNSFDTVESCTHYRRLHLEILYSHVVANPVPAFRVQQSAIQGNASFTSVLCYSGATVVGRNDTGEMPHKA